MPSPLIYTDFWRKRCVEPVKRKHGSLKPEWQHHRFEIKGGISWRDAMLLDMSQPNPLLSLVKFDADRPL
jgi:hypothetical protein